MARITVEDCLKNVDNRFALIHLAAKRVRQLRKGDEPQIICKNKDIVTSLREIAAGNVIPVEPEMDPHLASDEENSVPKEIPESVEEGLQTLEPEEPEKESEEIA